MEELIELTVTQNQIDLLREYSARVRFLYDVELRTEIRERGENCTFITLQVCIKSMIERSSNLTQAKNYIQSVCAVDRVERRCQYTPQIFHHLLRCRDRIERVSGAVLFFNPSSAEVLVWGNEYNVTNALFMLDQSAQLYISQSHKAKPNEEFQGSEPFCNTQHSLFVEKDQRRKLEAVDSSYDSDCEGSTNADADHDHVSRTVSDTLGAEFAEYINVDKDKLVSSLCESEHSTEDNSDESSASDGQYTNRVEYALKLGYTEDQVQLALQKLGANPEQNELLAELIKLGATCPNSKQLEELSLTDSASASATDTNDPGKTTASTVEESDSSNLHHIVIDGSNVAMSHGNKTAFSCRGIKLCVDWFKQRGHKKITVFVPQSRKETSRQEPRIVDQEILFQLEREGLLAFTPSRVVGGRRLICYDDKYILNLAAQVDGIVVSNDNYRDLINESFEYKKTVEERLLMFTFVNDRFMPPSDPLGRYGPSLDNFLKKQNKTLETSQRICPYLKKCTYGNKCKYQHPERGNMPQKLVSEMLAEQGKHQIQERKSRGGKASLRSTVSLPVMSSNDKKKEGGAFKKPLSRTSTNFASNLPKKFNNALPERTDLAASLRNKLTHTSSSPLSSTDHSFFRHSDDIVSRQHLKPPVLGRIEPPNIHRKLQREPSVNSVFDSQLGYAADQHGYYQSMHPPLSRNNTKSHWNSSQSQQSIWDDGHQAVTRIASAPDSCQQQWASLSQPRFAMKMRQASTSDSQLNICNDSTNKSLPQFGWHAIGSTATTPISSWPNPHGAIGEAVGGSQTVNQNSISADPQLIYHLCSLFPKEHVHAVLRMYPHETNAKKLCATILKMFPSNSSN